LPEKKSAWKAGTQGYMRSIRTGRSISEAPSTNIQAPEKLQTPGTKNGLLKLGGFSGGWSLEIGTYFPNVAPGR
jgi:hypothetical protein